MFIATGVSGLLEPLVDRAGKYMYTSLWKHTYLYLFLYLFVCIYINKHKFKLYLQLQSSTRVHCSLPSCLFVTSFSDSKKLASLYLTYLLLCSTLVYIYSSFRIANLYSCVIQIYQLECRVCVPFFVSLS